MVVLLLRVPQADMMTKEQYRAQPPRDPTHQDHQMPYHTEACFQSSQVIECDNDRDTRRCCVCGKEWTERCNFDDDFS